MTHIPVMLAHRHWNNSKTANSRNPLDVLPQCFPSITPSINWKRTAPQIEIKIPDVDEGYATTGNQALPLLIREYDNFLESVRYTFEIRKNPESWAKEASIIIDDSNKNGGYIAAMFFFQTLALKAVLEKFEFDDEDTANKKKIQEKFTILLSQITRHERISINLSAYHIAPKERPGIGIKSYPLFRWLSQIQLIKQCECVQVPWAKLIGILISQFSDDFCEGDYLVLLCLLRASSDQWTDHLSTALTEMIRNNQQSLLNPSLYIVVHMANYMAGEQILTPIILNAIHECASSSCHGGELPEIPDRILHAPPLTPGTGGSSVYHISCGNDMIQLYANTLNVLSDKLSDDATADPNSWYMLYHYIITAFPLYYHRSDDGEPEIDSDFYKKLPEKHRILFIYSVIITEMYNRNHIASEIQTTPLKTLEGNQRLFKFIQSCFDSLADETKQHLILLLRENIDITRHMIHPEPPRGGYEYRYMRDTHLPDSDEENIAADYDWYDHTQKWRESGDYYKDALRNLASQIEMIHMLGGNVDNEMELFYQYIADAMPFIITDIVDELTKYAGAAEKVKEAPLMLQYCVKAVKLNVLPRHGMIKECSPAGFLEMLIHYAPNPNCPSAEEANLLSFFLFLHTVCTICGRAQAQPESPDDSFGHKDITRLIELLPPDKQERDKYYALFTLREKVQKEARKIIETSTFEDGLLLSGFPPTLSAQKTFETIEAATLDDGSLFPDFPSPLLFRNDDMKKHFGAKRHKQKLTDTTSPNRTSGGTTLPLKRASRHSQYNPFGTSCLSGTLNSHTLTGTAPASRTNTTTRTHGLREERGKPHDEPHDCCDGEAKIQHTTIETGTASPATGKVNSPVSTIGRTEQNTELYIDNNGNNYGTLDIRNTQNPEQGQPDIEIKRNQGAESHIDNNSSNYGTLDIRDTQNPEQEQPDIEEESQIPQDDAQKSGSITRQKCCHRLVRAFTGTTGTLSDTWSRIGVSFRKTWTKVTDALLAKTTSLRGTYFKDLIHVLYHKICEFCNKIIHLIPRPRRGKHGMSITNDHEQNPENDHVVGNTEPEEQISEAETQTYVVDSTTAEPTQNEESLAVGG